MLNSISDSLKHLAKRQVAEAVALLSKFRSSNIHELSKLLYS